jgi:hypothetical protein
MLKKSPSGSLCPYYYMGGELHPLKYGSYFDKKEELLAIIKAEEEFILKSLGKNNRRIWIDLYETNLEDDIIEALVSHLQAIKHKIYNLCLVGCSRKDERKIKKKMKKYDIDLYNSTKYFSDPEIAKQWLIGKIRLQ